MTFRWGAPVVLLLLSVLFAVLVIDGGHNWGGDFALYIMQAEALLDGSTEVLREVNGFSMRASDFPNGPDLYPIGLPLMLLPVVASFGRDYLMMKVVLVLSMFFSGWATYKLFEKRVERKVWAFLVAVLVAFNFNTLYMVDVINSDIPFVAVSLWALFLADRYGQSESVFRQVLLGVVIGFSFLLRVNGVLLLGALGLSRLLLDFSSILKFRKYIKANWKALIPLVVFVGVFLVNAVFYGSGGGSYKSLLDEVTLGQVFSNVWYYATLPGDVIMPSQVPVLGRELVAVSLLFFVLLGMWGRFRKDSLFLLYIAMTLLLYIIWPSRQGVRFVLPITPFYFYYLFVGLNRLFSQKYARMSFAGFVLVSCVFSTAYTGNAFFNKNSDKIGRAESVEIFEYVKNNTAKEDRVVFEKPRVMYMLTGRQAVRYMNPNESVMRELGAKLYVVEGRRADASDLRVVFSNDVFTVYGIPEQLATVKEL
ncbi:hypothetical protein FUAX_27850 [Fulvitalea axinellae]|uniref:Glycosyltransferase RgtA/B/C/D-like domain-containing protein n=1 Tax=Fulvitalea axinellae TaxID=1182444 RepID=A0AAU9CQJ4_9BACT|nr:hypothetical protein FUAX_27850 [Fulvitalea axinellae]